MPILNRANIDSEIDLFITNVKKFQNTSENINKLLHDLNTSTYNKIDDNLTGATSVGAGNGLTFDGNTVILGGTLTGNTAIAGNGVGFSILGAGVLDLSGSKTSIRNQGTTSQIVQSATGTTIQNLTGGTASFQLDFSSNLNKATFYDFRSSALQTGIEYGADYSANYSNRSLVDYGSLKTYVSGLTSGGTSGTDTYVTGGTYSAGTAVFRNNTGGTFSVSGFSTGSTITVPTTQVAFGSASNTITSSPTLVYFTPGSNRQLYQFSPSLVNGLLNYVDDNTSVIMSQKFLTINGTTGLELTTPSMINGVTVHAGASSYYMYTNTDGVSINKIGQVSNPIGNAFTIDGKSLYGGLSAATAIVDIIGATTGTSSLRIRSGSTVTSPNDGDIWNDGNHLYGRVSGETRMLDNQPISLSSTFVGFGSSGNTLSGDSSWTYNTTTGIQTYNPDGISFGANYNIGTLRYGTFLRSTAGISFENIAGGQTGIQMGYNNNAWFYLVQYGASVGGTFGPTSLSNNGAIAMIAGITNDEPYYQTGQPIANIVGSTPSNYGTRLDENGLRITTNNLLHTGNTKALEVKGSIRFDDGTQGLGKVWTSDALGNASWQTLSTTTPTIAQVLTAGSIIGSLKMSFSTGSTYESFIQQNPISGLIRTYNRNISNNLTTDIQDSPNNYSIIITASGNTSNLTLQNTGMTITGTGSIPFSGAVYGADYSANFLPESLISKRYIDNAISGLTIAGNVSFTGASSTAFTVTVPTQLTSTYKVSVTPTSSLAVGLHYVSNKTISDFKVIFLSAVTGTVTFDWMITP